MNMNTNVIIGGIVILIVLVAGWWFTSRPTSEGSVGTTTTGSGSTTSAGGLNPSMVETGEAVTVRDQAAGESVAVASVTLTQNGWVAVRDSDGRVLGAARFDAGTWSDVSVPLLRATVTSSPYQVLLYVDDGDRQFDLYKDILITDASGGVAGTTFKTL